MKYVFAIIVICLIYFLLIYNKFVKLNNNINEAFSTMDVYFTNIIYSVKDV